MSQPTHPQVTIGEKAFASAARLGIDLGRLRPEHVTEWCLHDPRELLELSEGVRLPASITVQTRGGARLRLPDDVARLSKLPKWRLDGVHPQATFAFELHTRKRLLREGVPEPAVAELEIAVFRYRAQLSSPEGQRPRVESERRQVKTLWNALLGARDALRAAQPAIVADLDRTSHLWWHPLSSVITVMPTERLASVPGAPQFVRGSPAWSSLEGVAGTLDMVALAVEARVAALSHPQHRGRKRDENREYFQMDVASILEKAALKSRTPSTYDPDGGPFERSFRLVVEAAGLRLPRGENLRDVLRQVRHHLYWFRWGNASLAEKHRLDEERAKEKPPVSEEGLLRLEEKLRRTAPRKRRLPKDQMLREVLRLRQRMGISEPRPQKTPKRRSQLRRPGRSAKPLPRR
jgi:hypothetical protein